MNKNSRRNQEYPTWPDAGARARRRQPLAKRVGDLGQSGYQWVAIQRKRILSTRRGRVIASMLAAGLLLATLGSVGLTYAQYSHIKSEATLALAHVKAAEIHLKTLESNPFDTAEIDQAHNELGQANAAFIQMNSAIQAIPGVLALTPIVGSKLDAAFKIGPLAVEATQVGMLGCDILKVLAPKLKNPLKTNIPGVTKADIGTIDAKFSTAYSLASTMLQQVQELPPSASSLDPRLGPLLAIVSTHLPEFAQGLQDARNLIGVLPQLLGVGKPANYLMEVMDSSELRPGGGFIGNFGDLTLSGGRMQGKPQIKDVDLLDQHNCNLGLAIPADSSWFTAGCKQTLLFQDSNLDADFPTNAFRALKLYDAAGGSSLFSNSQGPITSFQGVIAITPGVIANAIQKITGPITVPQFNTTVHDYDLIQQIHYWQLTKNLGGSDTQIDPACGSSYRKAFTCELFKAFLATLSAKSGTNFSGLGKLLISSIHTKDIQIYLTDPGAEALLQHHDLASALTAPKSGDGLTVVDANEGGVKANNLITYTWNDQVSLDSSGNATHHLVLTYDWPYTLYNYQNAYPCTGCTYAYQDYLRIYIPDGSMHISLPENLPPWPPQAPLLSHGFGMTVIQGLMYFSIGDPTYTLSLSWTVPHAAVQTAGGWLYQYAVEKQAGINTRPLDVSLSLPSCAHVYGTLQGFTTPTAHSAVYHQPSLTSDVTLGLEYTC